MVAKKEKVGFDPSLYVRVYELAKSGLKRNSIAVSLKVTDAKLKGWMRSKPALQEAYDKGAAAARGLGAYGAFKEFAYGRLPKKAQVLWDELDRIAGEEKYNTDQVEVRRRLGEMWRKVEASPVRVQQHLFLYALVHCDFVISSACRRVGVGPQLVEAWARNDRVFADLMAGVHKSKKDFFEECLIQLARNGDSGAIIFANRTLNKDRGYADRTTIDINNKTEVTHKLDLEALSPETKRALLEDLRRKKEQLQLEDRSRERSSDAQVIDAEIVGEEL